MTGFWWSSQGVSVSNRLLYKTMPQDIGTTLIYVEVGVSTTGATKYRLSQAITVTPNQFTNTSKPVLVGTLAMGSRIKATLITSWEKGAKYSYQWLSNGVEVSGAVSSIYTITAADVDTSLSVRVCANKTTFAQKCEESLATQNIAKADIKTSAKPMLKIATTRLGAQVTGMPGKWQSGVNLSFAWLRDGVVIEGENRDSYVLTSADHGHSISFQVTGSKPGYNDLTRVSDSKVLN